MENLEKSNGVFPCKYCQGAVRWLEVDKRGILVNAKQIRVLVPVMKSVGNLMGGDMALMDGITYREVEAFKKHFCPNKVTAALPLSQGT